VRDTLGWRLGLLLALSRGLVASCVAETGGQPAQVPLRFTLKEPGLVTLVIDTLHNRVAPGRYQVRGLVRPQLDLRYEFTC